MPRPGCWTSGGSASFLPASRTESGINRLTDVSPLSVPILLEIGREQVYGQARDALLREAADVLIREAMRGIQSMGC